MTALRFTIDEALARGWITKAEAGKQKEGLAGLGREIQHDGRLGRLVDIAPAPTTKPRKKKSPKPERFICLLEGEEPQEKLWRACVGRWPELAKSGGLVWELAGAVPGRRFRLDIAFPQHKLACEVDGWEFHGKYLADFKRDRERDRLLLLEGWKVARFYANEIHNEIDSLIIQIERLLE